MSELDTYQICCSMCSTMVRGIGKEATEQGVKSDGWVLVDGGWWVCDECKPKEETEDRPAGMTSRTCHKCRRIVNASSRYFRKMPRPFECIACSTGELEARSLNAHYKHTSIDPLQYVEAMGDAEYRGACILNIVKYVTRYPHKGTPMEDLLKAQDYVGRLIEHQKKKEAKP